MKTKNIGKFKVEFAAHQSCQQSTVFYFAVTGLFGEHRKDAPKRFNSMKKF